MKKRFTFKCWNCNRKFSLFMEITEQQTLTVFCPFCDSECLVDLKPYPPKKVVLRGEGESEQGTEERELPEVLPTQKPAATDETIHE